MEYSDEQYDAIAERGDHIENLISAHYATGLLAALAGLLGLLEAGYSLPNHAALLLVVTGMILFYIGYGISQVFGYINTIHFYTDVMEEET